MKYACLFRENEEPILVSAEDIKNGIYSKDEEFIDPEYDGKIYIKNNHIAIDCGAVFGRILGCFCLNDFKEYYVE